MEKARVYRSYYRYEMCCQLFRTCRHSWVARRESADQFVDRGPWSPFDGEDNFFKHFAPWENEQLACVYEYFKKIMKRGLYTLNPIFFPLFLELKI
jgi:hypothetical protein